MSRYLYRGSIEGSLLPQTAWKRSDVAIMQVCSEWGERLIGGSIAGLLQRGVYCHGGGQTWKWQVSGVQWRLLFSCQRGGRVRWLETDGVDMIRAAQRWYRFGGEWSALRAVNTCLGLICVWVLIQVSKNILSRNPQCHVFVPKHKGSSRFQSCH